MKRNYVSPFAEKIEFNYANTVVASPGGKKGDMGIGNGIGGGCDGIDYHINAMNGGNGNCIHEDNSGKAKNNGHKCS